MFVELISTSILTSTTMFVGERYKWTVRFTHIWLCTEAPECCAVASSTWFKCMGGLLKCNAVIVCTAENYAKRLEQAARHDKDRGIWNVSIFFHAWKRNWYGLGEWILWLEFTHPD